MKGSVMQLTRRDIFCEVFSSLVAHYRLDCSSTAGEIFLEANGKAVKLEVIAHRRTIAIAVAPAKRLPSVIDAGTSTFEVVFTSDMAAVEIPWGTPNLGSTCLDVVHRLTGEL